MFSGRSILAVLLCLSSFNVATLGFAFDDGPSNATKARNSAGLQSSQASNVLGQIAIALAGGSEAMRALRGSQSEDTQQDPLRLPLPGMNCGINRILSYLSCYSAPIINEKEAENVFKQLVDDVKAALPRDRWRPVTVVPTLRSVRIISYQDRESGAQIDIELLVRPTMQVESAYVISLYGWTGI